MLVFSKITKSFSNQRVLDQLDLTIKTGQTTGLIGANGEGKTTLFKCLLDACQTDSGEILIGECLHTDSKARTHLAFLPEYFQAPFYFNGYEFLQLMLEMHQVDFNREHVESVLLDLLFDIKKLSQPVRNYSKGMMQKLGLTACLCSDKPLLILDEPMSGLDPSARYALKKLLIKQRKQGKTIIFSTHLLHDIESICDRIAVLAKGKIQFHGSVPEALEKYKATTLEQAYLQCLGATTTN